MTESDRELLALAAKAAGYVVKGEAVDAGDTFTHLVVNRGPGTRKFRWNPLTDPADALRLAVALGLWVHIGKYHVAIHGTPIEEHCGNDPLAATMRAITRTAAEVGRRRE